MSPARYVDGLRASLYDDKSVSNYAEGLEVSVCVLRSDISQKLKMQLPCSTLWGTRLIDPGTRFTRPLREPSEPADCSKAESIGTVESRGPAVSHNSLSFCL